MNAANQSIASAIAILKKAQQTLNLQHVLVEHPLATDGKTHACDSWKVGSVTEDITAALATLEGSQP